MLCRFSERVGIQGFPTDPPIHHEAREQGGFGAVDSHQEKHLSLELWGVCGPPS